MSLSRHSLEILIDLIEIKIGALQIQDKDDTREMNRLKRCRQELDVGLNGIRTHKTSHTMNNKCTATPPLRAVNY